MRLFKLRYSLRTFLVLIALVACWLGYHLRIKNERGEKLAWLTARGGNYSEFVFDKPHPPGYVLPESYLRQVAKISDIRLWLGDKAVAHIVLCDADVTWEDREQIAALFPEAWVIPHQPIGLHGREQTGLAVDDR
jgi:hypothetical protein